MKTQKSNGKPRSRKAQQAAAEYWQALREMERELSKLSLKEQRRRLKKMSADELHELMCATIARVVEEGGYRDFL